MSTFSDLKNKFIKFWESKGAKEIPGLSLVPQGDSTLLFVNSGMFPLVPYLLGEKHPLGTRLCNVQRCLRTEDLEDIGDSRHLTLFHMIGNWSLGDFFKKDQIPWVMELYVEHFGLDPKRIYVSVFEGDDSAPRDDESIELWKQTFAKYGITAEYSPDIYSINETLEGKSNARIFSYPKKKNWWTRGEVAGEPGGPDSEIFYDMGVDAEEYEEKLHINGDNGRFVEIGNNVFMQYKSDGKNWIEMEKKNVDFGGGLDRITMCVENKTDAFETSLYKSVITKLIEISGIEYSKNKRSYRIIVDHIKASIFLLADGVLPSNKDQGYILRRLIRRMIVQAYSLGIRDKFVKEISEIMIELDSDQEQVITNKASIISELEKEEDKFRLTLEAGIHHFVKWFNLNEDLTNPIEYKSNFNSTGGLVKQRIEYQPKSAAEGLFTLYERYGFPYEISKELFKSIQISDSNYLNNLDVEYNKFSQQHSDLSRTNSEQKFKGGLADNSEIVTALHTAHHLLLAAIQKVLENPSLKEGAEQSEEEGSNLHSASSGELPTRKHLIHQKGSNITAERLRIDFNFERKLTSEELLQIEKQVQEWIDTSLEVERLEMPREEAEKLGAEHEFGAKYPDVVSIYRIANPSLKEGAEQSEAEGSNLQSLHDSFLEGSISIEFCGGPHVENTNKLAEFGKFKILKEEASSAGVRRIKAGLVK